MIKKYSLTVLVILAIIGVAYLGYFEPASARRACADYAMNITVQSFPGSFEETGDEFPPYRLKSEAAVEASANYELFYNFCTNKRGIPG